MCRPTTSEGENATVVGKVLKELVLKHAGSQRLSVVCGGAAAEGIVHSWWLLLGSKNS